MMVIQPTISQRRCPLQGSMGPGAGDGGSAGAGPGAGGTTQCAKGVLLQLMEAGQKSSSRTPDRRPASTCILFYTRQEICDV
jgi:hypothetical protein